MNRSTDDGEKSNEPGFVKRGLVANPELELVLVPELVAEVADALLMKYIGVLKEGVGG